MHDQVGKVTECMLRERSAYSAPRTTATACTKSICSLRKHCKPKHPEAKILSCKRSSSAFTTDVLDYQQELLRDFRNGQWVQTKSAALPNRKFPTGCGKLHHAEQQADDKRCRVYCNRHGGLCCYCCCWPGRSPVMLQTACRCWMTGSSRGCSLH